MACRSTRILAGVGGSLGGAGGAGGTPFTGSETLVWALAAAALALTGLITLAATRKRRPEGSAG